jgi:hypothetical protein
MPEIKSAIITGADQMAFVESDITEFAELNKAEAMSLSKEGNIFFFLK